MQLFIKNLGIIICCLYCFMKLLHITPERKARIFLSAFVMLLSVLSIYVDRCNPHFTMPLLVLLMALFTGCVTKTRLSVSITAAAISFALSYSLFTFSSFIVSALALLIPETPSHTLLQLLCFAIQLLIMPVPFLFKRTRNGMPFLRKQFYSMPGMVISLLLLLISTTINSGKLYNTIFIILYLILIVLAFLIYIYWRNNLTKTYLDKLNMKNIESLNAELLEKQQYIEALEQDNRQLAKIIHKDNKLIPAMEYAVRTYIKESSPAAKDSERGMELLEELNRLSKDRKGMVSSQSRPGEKLPSCGVTSIDNLLQYIQQKAADADITFHVTLDCNVKDFLETTADEASLNTLLADLLENAIIATKYNNGKYILLNIGMLSKHYCIHVFDCGIPFTKEVLAALGQKQMTTHADDSGSGIGLMQTYEILKQYGASLLIDEFEPDSGLYTKKISVVFNKQNQYTLYTTRNEEELAYLNKRADLIIIRK